MRSVEEALLQDLSRLVQDSTDADENLRLVLEGALSRNIEVANSVISVENAVKRILNAWAHDRERLQKAERSLKARGFEDLGGEVWKPPLGDFAKTVEGFKTKDELVTVKEQLRRLTLFAQQNTNLQHIDDLCEHGAESGCCLSCSMAGPKRTKMTYSAKIIADSIGKTAPRLTTLEICFPRIVLAEFNTHRVLSRNSASSRAIPVERQFRYVLSDPFMPVYWGKNQKGMQAEQELTAPEIERASAAWLRARDACIVEANIMLEIGVHKQITNRLLEPFLWHTVIVTATEWSNFFHLRNNTQAQPEIQVISKMMQEVYETHEPEFLVEGEWHMPYIEAEDYAAAFEQGVAQEAGDSKVLMQLMVKISSARCARVSYLTHDGKRDLREDLAMYDRLLAPGHMSPFEHPARPATQQDVAKHPYRYVPDATPAGDFFFGNLKGWVQHRKEIPYESDFLAPRPETKT